MSFFIQSLYPPPSPSSRTYLLFHKSPKCKGVLSEEKSMISQKPSYILLYEENKLKILSLHFAKMMMIDRVFFFLFLLSPSLSFFSNHRKCSSLDCVLTHQLCWEAERHETFQTQTGAPLYSIYTRKKYSMKDR